MEEGLIIEDNKVTKCLPDTKTAVIPKNVSYIEEKAFCDCTKLTQIISESPNFASRLGCLYDTEQFRLIATVCGDVTVPREVRRINSHYAVANCTSIAFESGGSLMSDSLEGFDIMSFGYDNEMLKAMRKEIIKNKARAKKEARMRAATANAMIKHLIDKSGLDINTYRIQNGDDEDYYFNVCEDAGITALELPAADYGGVTAVLADENIAVWKETLPELLARIKNGINIADLVAYCRQHNLLPKSSVCRRYAVLSETLGYRLGENARFVESVWLPAEIENDEFFQCSLSCIIYEGTRQQFSGILAKMPNLVRRTAVRSVKCSDGEFELPTMLIESTPEGKVLKICNVYVESAVVPDGVCTIGDLAFCDCRQLTSLYLPDGVHTIGNGAFGDCKQLTSLHLPDGVRTIGKLAFGGCDHLTSIYLPEGVCTIGEEAFEMCKQLTSLQLPDGVRTIGNGAFAMCESLTSLYLPDGVRTIGISVFDGCSRLASLYLPGSIVEMGCSAFTGCGSLTELIYGGSRSMWRSIAEKRFLRRHHRIAESLESSMIKDTPLEKVKCADGDEPVPMMDIRDETLIYCRPNIEVINVPDGVTWIDSGAINKCECRSIKIPESVHVIEDNAIAECDNLETAEISGSIRCIGVFADCPKLMDITFGGTVSQWRSVNKDEWEWSLNSETVIHCTDGDI